MDVKTAKREFYGRRNGLEAFLVFDAKAIYAALPEDCKFSVNAVAKKPGVSWELAKKITSADVVPLQFKTVEKIVEKSELTFEFFFKNVCGGKTQLSADCGDGNYQNDGTAWVSVDLHKKIYSTGYKAGYNAAVAELFEKIVGMEMA